MDIINAMEISASGLGANRTRINVIAMNLANAYTTRTREGGPYERRVTVFEATPFKGDFAAALSAQIGNPVKGVEVTEVSKIPRFKRVYDPHHPDADRQGFVTLPDINIVEEMVNMMSANRAYEANVTAFNAAKSMAMKTLEIGR
jgi:flagellar basal-body rod protein FlgC